jgi:hypothetical protein
MLAREAELAEHRLKFKARHPSQVIMEAQPPRRMHYYGTLAENDSPQRCHCQRHILIFRVEHIAFVESPNLHERISQIGNVAGGPRAAAAQIDHLMRERGDFLRASRCLAFNPQRLRVIAEAPHNAVQPAPVGNAIIIRERHKATPRKGNAVVARRGWPTPRLAQEAKIAQALLSLLNHCFRCVG